MNVLESPIDALAFDYVSYGILNIVNNVWTWVAFVTAAISFWRIRSAASGAASLSVKSDDPPASTSNSPQKPPAIPQIENPRVRTSLPASTAAVRGLEVHGVTKGKFTVYYEDGDRDGGLSGVREREDKDGAVVCAEWWEGWESVLRTRRGERSWNGYQDLTAINGNVVKLWDAGVWKEEYSTRHAVW